ncbi:MAG: L-aspartate oxidase [Candidatus Cyclobacteriaceae bacterium M3_2C_046]
MEILESDFLVIGSGLAGLTFALKVADQGRVHLITKKKAKESNTSYAQGGIAAVISEEDNFDYHKNDTFIAGAGLCHHDAVNVLVEEGPARIKELIDWGVNFSRDKLNQQYDLAKEGGHSRSRILHAKDMTGAEVERALLEKIASHPNIHVFENHIAIDLITEHQALGNLKAFFNICFGAYVLDKKNSVTKAFKSKYTLLATGGASQVYLHSTNPKIATGDGIAMAYRAGVRIANMEFIQFHPTSLYNPGQKSFLISEALRGHGGRLINGKGKAFMKNYDERRDLAPRDIVARAIDSEMKKEGEDCVYLDMTHLDPEDVKNRFPNIYNHCLKSLNLDITRAPIPVVPAAHYLCGGVMTDLNGETSMQNLYASGEVAHTGVHGANRLASNSLLEALVFSHRAARHILNQAQFDSHEVIIPEWYDKGLANEEEWVLIKHNLKELQQVMWDYVGIVRSGKHLNRAYGRILFLYEEIENYYKRTKISPRLLALRNLTAIAYMIIRSARIRHESRGLHYMTDYPEPSDRYLKDTVIF